MKIILLCGGKGTRLKEGGHQKCMTVVGGKPFLAHIVDKLKGHEILFVVGHDAESVIDYFDLSGRMSHNSYLIVKDGQIPAVNAALKYLDVACLVINGDTLLPEYDYNALDTIVIRAGKGLYQSAGIYLVKPWREYKSDTDLLDSTFVRVYDGPMLELNTPESLEKARRYFNGA